MSTHKTILTSTLTLIVLALSTTTAAATPTRELVGTFGSLSDPSGIAVDLETGNVYVADRATDVVDVFGATGGAPAAGVPTQITGLHFEYGGGPAGIAVDNSCYEHEPRLTGSACEAFDPSYGDLYITSPDIPNPGSEGPQSVERFRLNSEHQKYELIEKIAIGNGLEVPLGVAVDSQGNIYVASYFSTAITELKTSGEVLGIGQGIVSYPGYVAMDDLGDVYVSEWNSGGVAKLKVDAAGSVTSEEPIELPTESAANATDPVAVDRSTGDVLVGDGSEIREYDAAGALQLEFGSAEAIGGSLAKAEAIAVNAETERFYVANAARGDVDVFGPVIQTPTASSVQPAAADATRTSVLVGGTVDPESGDASYHFEYVDAAGYESGAANPYGSGGRTESIALAPAHTDETVEGVPITSLTPGTTYHYRVVASNAAGTGYGPDETFTTAPATPPMASTGPAGDVSATGATLSGTVAPDGLPTSYAFEVGTDTNYGGAQLFGNAGSSTGEEAVTIGLQYLIPGTTYHYRLVATNVDGTSYGHDVTFTTPAIATPIIQPSPTALIPSPTIQFPSLTAGITKSQGASKAAKHKTKKKRKAERRKQPRGKAKTGNTKTGKAKTHKRKA